MWSITLAPSSPCPYCAHRRSSLTGIGHCVMWRSLTRLLWGSWILGGQIGFGKKNLICLLASTEVLYVFFPLWLYLSLMAMVQESAVSSHCSLVSNLCRKKKYLDLISSKTQPLFLTFEDEQAWGTTRRGCFRKNGVSFGGALASVQLLKTHLCPDIWIEKYRWLVLLMSTRWTGNTLRCLWGWLTHYEEARIYRQNSWLVASHKHAALGCSNFVILNPWKIDNSPRVWWMFLKMCVKQVFAWQEYLILQ